MRLARCLKSALSRRRTRSAGYTLLELLVVVIIVGILFAIVAPNWSGFLTNQRLNATQDVVYQAMRDTQSLARQRKGHWRTSFQETSSGVVQWAIHPANSTPTGSEWKSLDSNIRLDAETTLLKAKGIRRVEFNPQGGVVGQLGRITFSRVGSNSKRCVVVSTLLGNLRKGQEHPQPRDGKRCY